MAAPASLRPTHARWPQFSAALAEGRVPECSTAWREAGFKRYCYWRRFATVNVSAVCPQNRRCGKAVRRWRPPGLHEYTRSEAVQCLRQRWITFVGDSQARTVFNLLLTYLGASPWPGSIARNMTADAWWNAYAFWPAVDSLGLCNGGNEAGSNLASSGGLQWNVTSRNVSTRAASRACTRDHRLHDGTRVSFIFVGRLHKQWGTLCELVSLYSFGAREDGGGGGSSGGGGGSASGMPDAVVVSHSAWPMLKAPPATAPCDAASYARDLRALLRLLALGARPPASVHPSDAAGSAAGAGFTSPSHGGGAAPAACTKLPMAHLPSRERMPRMYFINQPRTQAPAAQRCLETGAWLAAQRWALSALRPSGSSRVEQSSGGQGGVQTLDAWHLADDAKSCDTAKECAAQPSPRMRDHVHYHLPVYRAMLLNWLNLFCAG